MLSHEFDILRYTPEFKKLWDNFVETSKNGTFLFKRDYMDYHSDLFDDSSFIFFRKGEPYCLLPGCEIGEEYSSHSGLTYGGLIMNETCRVDGILSVFNLLMRNLRNNGFKFLQYKAVPYIYHTLPSEEDLYALFRHNAILQSRNISSSLPLKNRLPLKKDRKEALRRAERYGVEVKECLDLSDFWQIVTTNLILRYQTLPVHSAEEMARLAKLFPKNIKFFGAFIENELIAGTVCYITRRVVHTQYIASTPKGKKYGAVDCLISFLMTEYRDKEYLDFGISCEDQGRFLNESLIYWKEGFGARGVCYDTYRIPII